MGLRECLLHMNVNPRGLSLHESKVQPGSCAMDSSGNPRSPGIVGVSTGRNSQLHLNVPTSDGSGSFCALCSSLMRKKRYRFSVCLAVSCCKDMSGNLQAFNTYERNLQVLQCFLIKKCFLQNIIPWICVLPLSCCLLWNQWHRSLLKRPLRLFFSVCSLDI